MSARLVVVSGTGTEIGKTQLAAALVLAWGREPRGSGPKARGPRVAGIKPVESGVTAELGDDATLLERLSTFHVKQRPPYMLRRAISPHLAARLEGRTVELSPILAYARSAAEAADGVVLELPGGLFSPLAVGLTNADVVAALAPETHLLVAPDRLGVLHDVVATLRAVRATIPGAAPTALVLVTPAVADTSTGTNAAELARLVDVPVAAVLPRASVEELASRDDIATLVGA